MRHTSINALLAFTAVLVMIASGCSSISSARDSAGSIAVGAVPREGAGVAGVAQGGAQDIGNLRELRDQGQIPAAAQLDDVGFFHEHKFELPDPSCGQSL